MAEQSNSESSFSHTHLIMLFKYIGISFVAGSVSHGVFSGTRSLATAGFGVVMFLIGQWLEYRQAQHAPDQTMWRSLASGALLAFGMGFFTGSLQHFPDSPERSLWVVPLGFAMTLGALLWMKQAVFSGAIKRYAASAFAVVGVISIAGFLYFKANPIAEDHGSHAHGGGTAHGAEAHAHASAVGKAGDANQVDRVINVTMNDTMRFEPSQISVRQNETIRFVVTNQGKIKHEMTLGSVAGLKEHAALMLKFPNMEHTDPNTVSLEAGKTGEMIWQFTESGTVDFACLQPGHFEAGMKGAVKVDS